jgi:hypothetical protein
MPNPISADRVSLSAGLDSIVVPYGMTPPVIAATLGAEQPMSWQWMAVLLRSTCQ